jgi:cytidylate kinase
MRSSDAEQILTTFVIAIDGPSGSGKTTTAREVARRLGLRHLDTGAMYRAVTVKAMQEGVDLADGAVVSTLAEQCRIDFSDGEDKQGVLLDGQDVTQEIRHPDVTKQVSLVSSYGGVRHAMVQRQRELADKAGVVLEGRDIGSVVLPGSDLKIYLDADTTIRAQRRVKELEARGINKSLDEMRSDMEERDRKDSTREVSPLKIPVGAQVVDTTAMTIDEQVEQVIEAARHAAERIAAHVVPKGSSNPLRKERFIWRLARVVLGGLLRLVWGWRIIPKDDTDYKENFIYASNHRSNADPPVVGASIPGELHFVAKESLFTWNRTFAKLITTYNAVPIRRGVFDREAMDRFLELLKDDRSIMIFPEGGRQSGLELGKPRPGVGYLALNSGRSVVPVYADGTASMWSALWRRPRLTIRHGRPIRLNGDLSRYQNREAYRDFGEMVLAAIQSLKDEHERGR